MAIARLKVPQTGDQVRTVSAIRNYEVARYIQPMHRDAPEAPRLGEWWITTRLREKPGVKRFWVLVIVGVVSAASLVVVFALSSGFPRSLWGLLIFTVMAPITCLGTAVAGYGASGAWWSLRRTPIRELPAGAVLSVLVGTILGAAVIVSGWFLVLTPTVWGWWEWIFHVGSPLLGAAYMLKSAESPLPMRPAL
ncbi:hypothetical protein [Microbacterium terricola]|uniref:Uncharacterized protein n=1 Tax=Microbacterium terricola TaxID=344163 RepID=A0ABM8DV31_9MICO|nr:hypothetical protein [Microbacterium terricola]UYK39874.1 hypothetical protein OAU46_14435 [Microbacterium terricola]BDV29370.1 hypothetical protein Microterr_00300 [Microbacterium terricola]